MRKWLNRVLIAAIMLPVAAPVLAHCDLLVEELEMSGRDRGRLDQLDESREKGLAAARKGGAPADLQVVDQLLGAPAAMPDADRLAGTYQCRTIKLGGITDLTVYGWFRCRITAGEEIILEKLTGSQNFVGTLTPAGGGYVFKGAEHYGYEGPRAYGADRERDTVGCLTAVGGDARHLVLELPEPRQESFHDVIELKAR